MKQRVGIVFIKDAESNVLLERPLADEFGFRGRPWEKCFFAFEPKDTEDVKACMMEILDWSLNKKPLTLFFSSMGPFAGYIVFSTAYDAETGSIRIWAEKGAESA
jgi:hypothetical protein